MTEELRDERDRAPTAEEIERQFRGPAVIALRPVLRAALSVLKFTRGFHWQAEFEQNLDRFDGPLVFAANHCSHADTAAILGTLPRGRHHRTAVAAALDVFGPDRNGGLKRKWSKTMLQLLVAAGFHAFAFDRHGPPLRSVRTSVQLIRNGWNLLLYPEGTRSRSGQMGPFKGGVGVLARFTGRPVIPVHVEGGQTILPYTAFLPRPGFARVRYGSPLWHEANESPMAFTARLEEAVRQLAIRPAGAPRPMPTPSAAHLSHLGGGGPQPATAGHKQAV